MASPTLMGLPRELRNIIYSHLYQRIEYAWPSAHLYQLQLMKVSLDNAPLTDVLLLSPQVHAEYRETLDDRRYSATVTTNPPLKKYASLDERINNKNRASLAILKIHDISLFASPQPQGAFWMVMNKFIKETISNDAPRLETLQIVTRISAPRPMIHGKMHCPDYIVSYEAATHPLFRLPSPPAALHEGMILVRHGEGYQLGCSRNPTTKLADIPGETEKNRIQHNVARLGVYGYTRTSSIETLITERDIVERWPMPRYTDDVLELLGDEAEEVRKWPEQIREWKEKREIEAREPTLPA